MPIFFGGGRSAGCFPEIANKKKHLASSKSSIITDARFTKQIVIQKIKFFDILILHLTGSMEQKRYFVLNFLKCTKKCQMQGGRVTDTPKADLLPHCNSSPRSEQRMARHLPQMHAQTTKFPKLLHLGKRMVR